MNSEVRQCGWKTSPAGRVEREQKDIVQEMTTMAMSVLAMRGILVSDRERTIFQKAIHEYVTQSVEIEAKLVELIERGSGPGAA
jgi:hypothetical protein